MPRVEILSPEGLRVDGRRPNDLRKISSKVGVISLADGSAYLEMGNTKVLAAVYGPRESHSRTAHDRAFVHVEFTEATFSKSERKRIRKMDRKNLEIASQIRDTFESVIKTDLYPRSTIDIYLQILQADGGQVQACINAATLAVIHAGIPVTDYVVACTVGNISGTPMLDLNHIEESQNVPELTVAYMPKLGKVVLLQMESRLHCDHLAKTLHLGRDGCDRIFEILDTYLRKELRRMVHIAADQEQPQ
ncbi:Exosome non-catalytic core component [Sorochytrium milnesiophthora]